MPIVHPPRSLACRTAVDAALRALSDLVRGKRDRLSVVLLTCVRQTLSLQRSLHRPRASLLAPLLLRALPPTSSARVHSTRSHTPVCCLAPYEGFQHSVTARAEGFFHLTDDTLEVLSDSRDRTSRQLRPRNAALPRSAKCPSIGRASASSTSTSTTRTSR